MFHVLVIIFKALLQRRPEPHGTEQWDVLLLKLGTWQKYPVEMGLEVIYRVLLKCLMSSI